MKNIIKVLFLLFLAQDIYSTELLPLQRPIRNDNGTLKAKFQVPNSLTAQILELSLIKAI